MQKKVVYKHDLFYIFLIILLCILIYWNIFNFYFGSNLSIISVVLQLVLLVMLIMKHEKTKIAFRIWSILVIVGASFKMLANFIKLFTDDDIGPAIETIIIHIILAFIGYIVYAYNERDVRIEYTEDKET